jgi:small subunit ribosomal protein S20
MPNNKQASKRNRQREHRRIRNRLVLGTMRTSVRRARTALADGAPEAAALIKAAVASIDRAVTKGSLKRRTASRYISRLVRADR